jgi:putative ABC transport system permease protein
MAAAVLFGVVPALRVSRPQLNTILRDGGRTPGLMGGGRLRDAAAIVEVALTFILLIGAGLMIRASSLRKADPGYDTRGC